MKTYCMPRSLDPKLYSCRCCFSASVIPTHEKQDLQPKPIYTGTVSSSCTDAVRVRVSRTSVLLVVLHTAREALHGSLTNPRSYDLPLLKSIEMVCLLVEKGGQVRERRV